MFSDPQLQARGQFVFMSHAEMGTYASDGNSFVMSGATPAYRPAPLLGEHTEEICRGILGMTEIEFKKFQAEDVLS